MIGCALATSCSYPTSVSVGAFLIPVEFILIFYFYFLPGWLADDCDLEFPLKLSVLTRRESSSGNVPLLN